MSLSATAALFGQLGLPVIAAPMFIVSGPELVIAQCKAGIVGSFPALNARPSAQLDEWLHHIAQELAAHDRLHPHAPAAPFAVNLIVHRTNDRLLDDLALCAKHKVPLIITSLGAQPAVNAAVHDWGGVVLHDVINDFFARKAIEKGADGLIAVAAGAGGHAGVQSPFALMQEIRSWFDGPVALSGAIACGRSILAAQAMGADVAYIGSALIATDEANAAPGYKLAITQNAASDIVYSDLFTGVHGNYLRPSLVAAGFDPDHLPQREPSSPNFGLDKTSKARAWKDLWGAGQGIGAIRDVVPVAVRVAQWTDEYQQAQVRLGAKLARNGSAAMNAGA